MSNDWVSDLWNYIIFWRWPKSNTFKEFKDSHVDIITTTQQRTHNLGFTWRVSLFTRLIWREHLSIVRCTWTHCRYALTQHAHVYVYTQVCVRAWVVIIRTAFVLFVMRHVLNVNLCYHILKINSDSSRPERFKLMLNC